VTFQIAKKLSLDIDLKKGIFPVKKGIIIWDWTIENRADLLSSVYMDNEQISAHERQLMFDYLIPGFYLKRVAGK
jgi:hypothetical protein